MQKNTTLDQQNTHTELNDNQKTEETTDPSIKNIFPKVTFSTFILSLASSALSQLGEVPNPETGKISQDLPMAKHTIEILSMLENKTKECLDSDEFRLLQGILYELRMKYVMKQG